MGESGIKLLQEAVTLFTNLAKQYRDCLITRDDVLELTGEFFIRVMLHDSGEVRQSVETAYDRLEEEMDETDNIRSGRLYMSPDELFRDDLLKIFNSNENDLYNPKIPFAARWYYAAMRWQSISTLH